MPNNLDLFSWSLPFLADKIGEMMDSVIKKSSIIPREKIKLVKQNSDVDFGKIMNELQEE